LNKVRRLLWAYACHALEECGQRRAAFRAVREFLKRMKISNLLFATGGAKAAIYLKKRDATGTLRERQFQWRARRSDLGIGRALFRGAWNRRR
jgi:hypothetical protein